MPAMLAPLPLVEPHRRAHTYCAFCPKMCRFACPVGTAHGREATSPWGKMTSLHHAAGGTLPLSSAIAATWWACTGCMRCRTYCNHRTEVASALGVARAEATRQGLAPRAVYEFIEKHPERERRARDAATAIFGDALVGSTRTVLFVPGCTACVASPDDALAALHAVQALSSAPVGVHMPGCCGLPLLKAGDHEGFVAALERFAAPLGSAKHAVFQDPGCLYALRMLGPAVGIRVHAELLHVSELADRASDRLRPWDKLVHPVRYVDACKLGRGLGVYDPPRRVLAAIAGAVPAEAYPARSGAHCSGGGGLLPITDPLAAEAIAADRIHEHETLGGGTLVTGCPSAKRRFLAAGANVVDFSALVGRALGG